MASVSGVLLAAGSSERMGFPKQLIQIGKEPLIRRTARIALEVFPLTVILGHKKRGLSSSAGWIGSRDSAEPKLAGFNGETDRVIAAAYSEVLGTPVLFGSG